MDVGRKIKLYLLENDIQQKHLSEKTGITTAKLNLSLNNKRRMTFSEYETICWALGVPVDTFLEARKPKKDKTK